MVVGRLKQLRAFLLGISLSPERLRADGADIGDEVRIGDYCLIDRSHRHLVTIGDRAGLAPRVVILAHDASIKRHLGYTRIGRVDIGADAWIGTGSIILPGVTIGHGALIGAGSVVTGDIAPETVAVGNPCRAIGTVAAFVERRRLEMMNAPVWEADGWTIANGITPERMVEMRTLLNGHFGFVE